MTICNFHRSSTCGECVPLLRIVSAALVLESFLLAWGVNLFSGTYPRCVALLPLVCLIAGLMDHPLQLVLYYLSMSLNDDRWIWYLVCWFFCCWFHFCCCYMRVLLLDATTTDATLYREFEATGRILSSFLSPLCLRLKLKNQGA